MKKVLFIAYEFPPRRSGGTYRPMSFVRHLKEFGYEPIVATLTLDVIKLYELDAYQESFGGEISLENEIIRIPSSIPPPEERTLFMSVRDHYFSANGIEGRYWKENFLSAIPKIMQQHRIELIFITAPPFSVVDLGIEISKKYHLPLVSDLRDAWSNWFTTPYASYLHYLYKRKKEAYAMNLSSAIIATSKQTIFDFQRLHPEINKQKFHYIPNGFENLENTWENDLGKKGKIVIGYVGSFYYSVEARQSMMTPWYKKKGHRMLQYSPNIQDWLYRSPYFFFKALSQLFAGFPDMKDRVTVKFAGNIPDWMDGMLTEFNLKDKVEFLGLISHDESLKFQRSCDLLLLTSAKVIGGKDYSIAGKTFEYFQNQKPILGFVCEGAQKVILEESGMAIICDPDDTPGSAELLRQAILGNMSIQPDLDFIQKHSRRELTKSLAQIFDLIIKK